MKSGGGLADAALGALRGSANIGNTIINSGTKAGANTGAAATGAGAGLIDPNSAGTGAVIGGLLPPVIGTMARAGGAVVNGVRGLVDMATPAGQNRIAEAVMRASATDPAQAAARLAQAWPVVPGSLPTTGQVAEDAGLAQLERTLLNNPQTAAGLQRRFAEQRAARGAAINEVAATGPNSGSYYDDLQEGPTHLRKRRLRCSSKRPKGATTAVIRASAGPAGITNGLVGIEAASKAFCTASRPSASARSLKSPGGGIATRIPNCRPTLNAARMPGLPFPSASVFVSLSAAMMTLAGLISAFASPWTRSRLLATNSSWRFSGGVSVSRC